jgi:hypothetical protein
MLKKNDPISFKMNYNVGTVRYTESFPMWCWRRLEWISWNKRVTNEGILEEM